MNKEDLIKLSKAVYRVTDVFPKNEPLKQKLRELGDDILADLVFFQSFKSIKNSDSVNLKSY